MSKVPLTPSERVLLVAHRHFAVRLDSIGPDVSLFLLPGVQSARRDLALERFARAIEKEFGSEGVKIPKEKGWEDFQVIGDAMSYVEGYVLKGATHGRAHG